MNLAENASAFKAGQHPGYVESAWAGLEESLESIAEKGIKVVINGGSLNPSGLAEKVSALVREEVSYIAIHELNKPGIGEEA